MKRYKDIEVIKNVPDEVIAQQFLEQTSVEEPAAEDSAEAELQ